jgi:hypothetical protein
MMVLHVFGCVVSKLRMSSSVPKIDYATFFLVVGTNPGGAKSATDGLLETGKQVQLDTRYIE